MSDPQKTERATPKRLREAREKGELPRSRELSTAIVVATGVVALMVSGAGMAAKAADWLKLALQPDPAMLRSEEHTSELQSLMRISYAVFCLKKKNHPSTRNTNGHHRTKPILTNLIWR